MRDNSFLSGLSERVCELPAIGEQFVELVLWMSSNAGEQIAEIGEGIDKLPLAAGDQSGQHCAGASAYVAAIEQPVFAADHDRSQAALGAVVVDF